MNTETAQLDAIAIQSLTKTYGSVRAVDSLTLRIQPGETVALLGPNGAGKTTTIELMLGLQRPDSGTVRVLGAAPRAAVNAGRVGAMLQDGGLMPGARVGELLTMLASQYAAPLPTGRVIELAQLDGLQAHRVDRLSGGQLQRLRVAVALIGDPELLVLDEPTAAMDVEARRAFWAAMADVAASGRTVIFSTHHLEEADDFAGRVVLIARGTIVADGSPSGIKASLGARSIRFSTTHSHDPALVHLPGVVHLNTRGHRVEVHTNDSDATLRAVIARCGDAHDIEITAVGLEDAFIALTAARAA